MKKLIIIISLLLFSSCFAGGLDDYYKLYPKDADTLFIQALNALNSPGFEICEIQSRNGYILFYANSKYFMLTITKRYKNQSEVKILPQNSDFANSKGVAKTLFSLIDSKINQSVELKK